MDLKPPECRRDRLRGQLGSARRPICGRARRHRDDGCLRTLIRHTLTILEHRCRLLCLACWICRRFWGVAYQSICLSSMELNWSAILAGYPRWGWISRPFWDPMICWLFGSSTWATVSAFFWHRLGITIHAVCGSAHGTTPTTFNVTASIRGPRFCPTTCIITRPTLFPLGSIMEFQATAILTKNRAVERIGPPRRRTATHKLERLMARRRCLPRPRALVSEFTRAAEARVRSAQVSQKYGGRVL